ncbi:MAG: DUF2807 domain-containing protein, partial [Flavobacterium sp.]
MVQLVKIVVGAYVALLFSSCKGDIAFKSITGSGKVVTEERNVGTFTKIEVANGLECEVIQSEKITVAVEADDNLQKGIITKVENGTLKIHSIYNNYTNVSSKKIKVQMPTIASLETTSGSTLTTRNIIKGNDISLKSSSGSDLEANIESDKITLESTSGSTMTVSGKAL